VTVKEEEKQVEDRARYSYDPTGFYWQTHQEVADELSRRKVEEEQQQVVAALRQEEAERARITTARWLQGSWSTEGLAGSRGRKTRSEGALSEPAAAKEEKGWLTSAPLSSPAIVKGFSAVARQASPRSASMGVAATTMADPGLQGAAWPQGYASTVGSSGPSATAAYSTATSSGPSQATFVNRPTPTARRSTSLGGFRQASARPWLPPVSTSPVPFVPLMTTTGGQMPSSPMFYGAPSPRPRAPAPTTMPLGRAWQPPKPTTVPHHRDPTSTLMGDPHYRGPPLMGAMSRSRPSAGPRAMVAHTSPGLSSSAFNSIKLLAPFNSDATTPEQAKLFWDMFELNTQGLDDATRVQAFLQKLKGKIGESWWSNSRIDSFDKLRRRFFNRFIYLSVEQLLDRLRNAHRQHGESMEEWADRVNALCEQVKFYDPLGRYQYFLDGLRHKRVRSLLDNNVLLSIEDACQFLEAKNMLRPIEDEDEFSDEKIQSRRAKAREADDSAVLQQVNQLSSQFQSLLQMQQQQQQQLNEGHARVATMSELVEDAMYMATTVSAAVPPGGESFRGISQSADQRTQEGRVICGRCQRLGHGRATCARQYGTCRNCGELGHFSIECTEPRRGATPGGRETAGAQQRTVVRFDQSAPLPPSPRAPAPMVSRGQTDASRRSGGGRVVDCFLCGSTDHMAVRCPWRGRVQELLVASGERGSALPPASN